MEHPDFSRASHGQPVRKWRSHSLPTEEPEVLTVERMSALRCEQTNVSKRDRSCKGLSGPIAIPLDSTALVAGKEPHSNPVGFQAPFPTPSPVRGIAWKRMS